MKTGLPSPARSQGGPVTPRRYFTRRTRSVGSPARSNTPGRLSTIAQQLKEDEMASFVASPINRRSILTDNTTIEMPGRKSWWKKLNDTSGDVMAALHSEKVVEDDNVLEEYIHSDGEVLSQEKKNYSVELSENSGSDTIDSIVLPQRKLFTQLKENIPEQRFSKVIGERDTLAKHQKSKIVEKSIHIKPKKIFQESRLKQSIFPAHTDLIDKNNSIKQISPKTKNIFGRNTQNVKATVEKITPVTFLNTPEKEVDKKDTSKTKSVTQGNAEKTKNSLPLVNISANKTGNVTSEIAATVQFQGRNLFGNRGATKRKNIFADFKLDDSEEEIPEIQPKIFGFQRKPELRDSAVTQGKKDGRLSPTSSIATDIEMDDWNLLPSSTMIADKLDDVILAKSVKETEKNEEDDEDINLTYEHDDEQIIETDKDVLENDCNNLMQRKTKSTIEDIETNVNANSEAGGNENMEKNHETHHDDELKCAENQVKSVRQDDEDENAQEEIKQMETETDIESENEIEQEKEALSQIEDSNQNENPLEILNEQDNEKEEATAEHAKEFEEVVSSTEPENGENYSDLQDSDNVQEENDQAEEAPSEIDDGNQDENQLEIVNEQDYEKEKASEEHAKEIEEVEKSTEPENSKNYSNPQHFDNVQEENDQAEEVPFEIKDSNQDDNQLEILNEQDDEKEEAMEEHAKEIEKVVRNIETKNCEYNSDQQDSDNIEDENVQAEDVQLSDHEIQIQQTDEDQVSNNITHDTTGRFRNQVNENKLSSPETIRKNISNLDVSFKSKGRNTSVRKTKSMIKPIEHKISIASVRDSVGDSESSAQGSGWDSHRVTRKTIRQTFGKGYTPRKSLRALVLEQSAKRQTIGNTLPTESIGDIPQANSTEYGDEVSAHHDVEMEESDHEVSRANRLEILREKLKQVNKERKKEMESKLQESLKASTRGINDLFKVPLKPSFAPRRGLKGPQQNKPKPKTKPSAVPMGELPAELIEELKYRPPKRFAPSNASWTTNRLYKFLETKLEPKYDYKARVRAEKLMETLYNFTKLVRRLDLVSRDVINELKFEMARLNIVQTHFEFYEFFHEFMPREIRTKVIPDAWNKYPLPRRGIYSDILVDDTMRG